jgi:hypothetical protein
VNLVRHTYYVEDIYRYKYCFEATFYLVDSRFRFQFLVQIKVFLLKKGKFFCNGHYISEYFSSLL